MRKFFLITILSLACMATFAAKSNKLSDKLNKEQQTKMLSQVNLSYTTSCGTTVSFTISSENMNKVGLVVDAINDEECGTSWFLDDYVCYSAS